MRNAQETRHFEIEWSLAQAMQTRLAMTRHIPKNGLLSGMIIPGLTAAVALTTAFVSSTFRSYFASPLSTPLLWMFFASAVLMALHKLESFWFEEYEQCPVYTTQDVSNPRKAVFLGFVPIFIGMLFFSFMSLYGPPWQLIALTVWLGQGLHELHHSAKSLARGRVYPGLISSVLFVGLMAFGLFPLWHDLVVGAERGLIFFGFYALMPLVFLGFYVEDREWIAHTPSSVWNPLSHRKEAS